MISTISSVQLFQIFRQKMGEEEAKALVDYVDSRVNENNENNLKILSTKDDISHVEIKTAKSKSDLIKWMVSFFLALALIILDFFFLK